MASAAINVGLSVMEWKIVTPKTSSVAANKQCITRSDLSKVAHPIEIVSNRAMSDVIDQEAATVAVAVTVTSALILIVALTIEETLLHLNTETRRVKHEVTRRNTNDSTRLSSATEIKMTEGAILAHLQDLHMTTIMADMTIRD